MSKEKLKKHFAEKAKEKMRAILWKILPKLLIAVLCIAYFIIFIIGLVNAGKDAECRAADDFGQYKYGSESVSASRNSWTKVEGLTLSSGDLLGASIMHDIELCAPKPPLVIQPSILWNDLNGDGEVTGAEWNTPTSTDFSPTGPGGKLAFLTTDWNSRNSEWYHVPVSPGERFILTVTGKFSVYSVHDGPSVRNHIYEHGQGLEIKVSDGTMIPWPGSSAGGVYSITIPDNPSATQLQFRHGDFCVTGTTQRIFPDNPSVPYCKDFYWDNRGGYTLTLESQGCVKSNGENLYYKISNSRPANNFNGAQSLEGGIPARIRVPNDGNIWLRIYDPDNVYTPIVSNNPPKGNNGSYRVSFNAEGSRTWIFTDMSQFIIEPVMELLNTTTFTLYTNFVDGPFFKQYLRSMLLLYVTVLSIFFVMGMVDLTQKELVIRVVKFGIIIQLMSPTSFEFFNTYLFSFFTNGITQLMNVFAGATDNIAVPTYDPSTLKTQLWDRGSLPHFGFLDQTISAFFSQATWLKILALFATGPLTGLAFGIMIILGIVIFVVAAAKSVLVYLLSLIGVALMVVLAPIFISFIMFERTKEYFDAWLKQLIGFALQPIFIMVSLVMFSFLIQAAMNNVLGYAVCWKCIVNFPMYSLLGLMEDFCLLGAWMPWGMDNNMGPTDSGFSGFKLPITLGAIIMFLIIAQAAYKFSDFAVNMATVIAGVSGGAGLVAPASKSVARVKSAMGLDDSAQAAREKGKDTKTKKRDALSEQRAQERREESEDND